MEDDLDVGLPFFVVVGDGELEGSEQPPFCVGGGQFVQFVGDQR